MGWTGKESGPLARSRKKAIVLVLAAAAAIVAFGARDTAAVLYYVYEFRADSALLCKSLFQDSRVPRGKAARRCFRATEWETKFEGHVAGKSWQTCAGGWPGAACERNGWELELSAYPKANGYEVQTVASLLPGTRQAGVLKDSRNVTVWGPFLVDAGDPGRVDTWGLIDGKLAIPALVRVSSRLWLMITGRNTSAGVRHSLLWFRFDPEPEAGQGGKCLSRRTRGSPEPLIRSDAPVLELGKGQVTDYSAAADPGAGEGRLLVTVAAGSSILLHLDRKEGTGWVESWETVLLCEGSTSLAPR